MRRLPARIQHGLFTGRRWQRRIVAQLRSRWHRSLQLRVVSTTLVLSALVIAVLGFFLVESISAGLLSSAENSARTQVENGATTALDEQSLKVLQPVDPLSTADAVVRTLQQASGTTGSYLVFVQLTGDAAAGVNWVGPGDVNITATIPQDLINAVGDEQRSPFYRSDNDNVATPWIQPTTVTYTSGSRSGRGGPGRRRAARAGLPAVLRVPVHPAAGLPDPDPADPDRRRSGPGRPAGRDRLAGDPVGGPARPARGPGGAARVGRSPRGAHAGPGRG